MGRDRLRVLGGFVEDGQTILMIGPDEPTGFWAHFQRSEEAQDGVADPIDRWSTRVLGACANDLSAKPLLPFGGPPYLPFYSWALKTGRIHESPVKLLVHDEAGLWVSFRGALRFDAELDLPAPPPSPCVTCEAKPCLTACPIGALTEDGYDVPGCRHYLGSSEGKDCMTGGCKVRSVCPVSQGWSRVEAQSQLHMAAFAGK